jgi:hypothetical protein
MYCLYRINIRCRLWLNLVALPNVVGGKGTVDPIHAVKTYRSSGSGDPFILNLGTG